MNMTSEQGVAMVAEFKELVKDVDNCEIVLCPTVTTIPAVVEALKGSNVKVGAQNIAWAESGAFTGELSATMLKELGIEWIITGHSERRQYFGETDATVNARTKAALEAGFKVMVCIGETKDEREDNVTNAVCDIQLKRGLKGLTAEDMENIVIAYEPVWAIGTGLTATPEMAQETHAACRATLVEIFGKEVADKVRIQYGGSMKAANSKELVGQADIDGGLVGGASLKAQDFAELTKNAVS
jgi:triosephosphate isomerase